MLLEMSLIVFDLGLGIAIGGGLYFLLIRPALKERAETKAAKEKQDQ